MSKQRTDICPSCKEKYRSLNKIGRRGRVYAIRQQGMQPIRKYRLKGREKLGRVTYATCFDPWHEKQTAGHNVRGVSRYGGGLEPYSYRSSHRPHSYTHTYQGNPPEAVETPATTINLHSHPDVLKMVLKKKARAAKARRSKDRK